MRIPVVAGSEILTMLDDANSHRNLGLVYHGGPLVLDRIDPQDCFMWLRDKRVPDSEEPVVCASDNLAIATFRALVPRTDKVFGCSRVYNSEGGVNLMVQWSAREKFFEAVGYLGLCDETDFDRHVPITPQGNPGVPEYRRTSSAMPECIVRVDYIDFANLMCDPKHSGNRLFFIEGNEMPELTASPGYANTLGYV